jgi:hypothetical protein
MTTGGALTLLHLLLVHLVPWGIGFLLIRNLLQLQGAGSLSLQLGVGGAAGMPLVTASIWLVDFSGQPFSMGAAMAALFLVGLALWLVMLVVGRVSGTARVAAAPLTQADRIDGRKVARTLSIVLAGLVALRLISLLPDITQRPLFPWDAWKTWAWKARVWFEHRELLSFVTSSHWPTADADTYVIDGVNHPDFVSLIFLWSALAVGEWNDRLIGLAWFLAGIWCCLMTWGVLRFSGLPRVFSWLGVYLLMSLPLVAAHIALFGYADLWVMLYFLVFSVGLVLWAGQARWRFGVLMLLAAVMMALTKDTGGYWAPALVLAVAATRLPARVVGFALLILAVIAGAVYWLGFDPVAMLSGGRYLLSPQPTVEVLAAIGKHLFVWLDWHLLWYVMPMILVLGFQLRRQAPGLRAVLWLSLLVLCTAVAGFVGSRAADYAIVGTLFSRVVLSVVPVFVLLFAMVGWEVTKCWAPGLVRGDRE